MTAPELWWSVSAAKLNPGLLAGLFYSTLDGVYVTPSYLPADAVRLVPARDVTQRAELIDIYDTAVNSVLHGVEWTGSYDSIGGVSKDEALADAAALLRALIERGGLAALLAAPVPDNTTEEA